MLPTFQTARLTIRPLTLADAENLFEIYHDDRAMQFMPTPPHTEIEQTREAELTATHPIYFSDEMRFGLWGQTRRHWGLRGIHDVFAQLPISP